MKGKIIWIAVLAVVAASLIFGSFRDRKEKAVTVPTAELQSDDFNDFRGDFRSESNTQETIHEPIETLAQPPIVESEWVLVENSNPIKAPSVVVKQQNKKKGLAALFQKKKSSSSSRSKKPLLDILFRNHHNY